MNQNKPLVTVITVIFNLIKGGRKKIFYQCLESVHSQTYSNIEHLVIDGGSKDGTVELLKEYAQKGWIKYISEPDIGIYDAMNKGIKLSKGKYIVFLNSDDYYHNKIGLEISVKALEESGADFSFAPVVMLNPNGSITSNTHPHRFPKMSNVFNTMPFCHQTMVTKRSVLIEENMFDTSYKSAADYDLVLRMCLKKRQCILVNETFTTFRLGGTSDLNQRRSIDEVTNIHHIHYSKLAPVTKEECKKIYHVDPSRIPLLLAKKLRVYGPYFNYEEYIEFKRLNANGGLNKALDILVVSPAQKFYLRYFRSLFKPTPTDVIIAYKCFFGRKPENKAVIVGHMYYKNVWRLVTTFQNLEEFKTRTNQRSCQIYIKDLIIRQTKRAIPLSLKQPIKRLYYSISSKSNKNPLIVIENTEKKIFADNYKNINSAYEYLFSRYFGILTPNKKRCDLTQRLLGTPPSEAYYIISLLEKTKKIKGDVCEFGVAQGETSALIANEIMLTTKKLHLFDSFEGLPKPTSKDTLKDDIFQLGTMEAYTGTMSCPEDMVVDRLTDISFPLKRCVIHKGFIEKLIVTKKDFPKEVSFAYIDFDFYEPIKITLDFLDEITDHNAVIMVDDYDFFSTGVKVAVDEFISEKNKQSKKYELYIPDKIFGCFAILTKL